MLIFGFDNSPSSHIDDHKNDFLNLGESPTDDISDSFGTAKEKLVLTLVKQDKILKESVYYITEFH